MVKTGYAYFVRKPRIIEDLVHPHLIEQERCFKVAKTVTLSGIQYKNFLTDMLADRQFIEDNEACCCQGEIWSCILVRQHGRDEGVLVMPENGCYVGWAAIFSE